MGEWSHDLQRQQLQREQRVHGGGGRPEGAHAAVAVPRPDPRVPGRVARMSGLDWREMASDEAMPMGFQQAAELPTTEDESWTHSGCGGTVVFDMSGGFCTRCHAENLDHEIGEAVRDTPPPCKCPGYPGGWPA